MFPQAPKAQTGANTLAGSAHIGPRGTEPLGLVISAHQPLYLLIPVFQHLSPSIRPLLQFLLPPILSFPDFSPCLRPRPSAALPTSSLKLWGFGPPKCSPSPEGPARPTSLAHWQGALSKHSHGQPAEVTRGRRTDAFSPNTNRVVISVRSIVLVVGFCLAVWGLAERTPLLQI